MVNGRSRFWKSRLPGRGVHRQPKGHKPSGGKKFQVVVTDLKMSGPSGLDVLRFLKDHQKDTEAIVITGYATIERAREAEFLNAKFVTKPFKLEEIVKLVEKVSKKYK